MLAVRLSHLESKEKKLLVMKFYEEKTDTQIDQSLKKPTGG
jgi:DNA-directed RNA polymerase specialized sigma subunit